MVAKNAKAVVEGEAVHSEAATVGAYAQEAVHVERRVFTVGKGDAAKTFVLVRDGQGGEKLTEVDPRGPHMAVAGRIVQRVTLETADSLIAYVNRFKADGETTLFASIKEDRFQAVLDYHTPDVAGFGEHTATLALQRSEEWKAWAQFDGKLQSQLEFVRFLDENRADIVSPDAASLLELCRDLQGLRKADFRSVVRHDAGNMKIEYAENSEVKRSSGEILMPTEFLLRLPVYFGGESYDLFALLIWKIGDVKEGEHPLSIGYQLKRPEKLRQAVFLENVVRIGNATGVEVVHGKRGGSD